jgi:hypothetical protein
LSRASDEYFHDNSLDVRIHIDAHLCKPECGNLGTVNQEYKKGVVYLAIYKGPLLAGVFYKMRVTTVNMLVSVIYVRVKSRSSEKLVS